MQDSIARYVLKVRQDMLALWEEDDDDDDGVNGRAEETLNNECPIM